MIRLSLRVVVAAGAIVCPASVARAQAIPSTPSLSAQEEEARFEAAFREMHEAYSRCYKAGMFQSTATFDRSDALAKCMDAAERVRLVRLQSETLTSRASLAAFIREIPTYEWKAYGAVRELLRTATPTPESARSPSIFVVNVAHASAGAGGSSVTIGPSAPDEDNDGIPDTYDACRDKWGVADPDPRKHGCPKSVMMTDTELVILQQVQFNTAKATILPASRGLLDEIASVLRDHPEIVLLEVQGHTDNRGPHAFNLKLSQARADAVKAELVARGISPDRMAPKGYGPNAPLRENTTEENRRINRRVQFRILERRKKDGGVARPAPERHNGDLGPEFAPSAPAPKR